jgi:ribosomal protein S18 acetylase RimI-like enzyme
MSVVSSDGTEISARPHYCNEEKSGNAEALWSSRRRRLRIGSVFFVSCLVQPSHGFLSPNGIVLQRHSGTTFLHVVEVERNAAPQKVRRPPPRQPFLGLIADITSSAETEDEKEETARLENLDESDSTKDVDNQSSWERSMDDDDAVRQRLAATAKTSTLLDRRRRVSTLADTMAKNTSVGARRMGSATNSRQGTRSTDRLMDALRKSSSANTVDQSEKAKKDTQPRTPPNASGASISRQGPQAASIQFSPPPQRASSFFEQVNKSSIHAAVAEMLDPTGAMGLFPKKREGSEPQTVDHFVLEPGPGTVLLEKEQNEKGGGLTVRVSTRFDDHDIANLRLSVFSNFPPSVQKQFCARSCQLLASRRSQGATSIVATTMAPRRPGTLQLAPRQDVVVGSAEASVHEFYGTRLGRNRIQESILYVTEVAVSPAARRQGVGMKLMEVRNDKRIRDRDVILMGFSCQVACLVSHPATTSSSKSIGN